MLCPVVLWGLKCFWVRRCFGASGSRSGPLTLATIMLLELREKRMGVPRTRMVLRLPVSRCSVSCCSVSRLSVAMLIAVLVTIQGGEASSETRVSETPPALLDGCYSPPPDWVGRFGHYRSPLFFDNGTRVTNHQDWERRRQELSQAWQRLLGPWPELIREQSFETLERRRREGIDQRRIRFAYAPDVPGEGILLVPPGDARKPAVLVVYYDAETSAGLRDDRPLRDFAWQLARRGFVTLAIGSPGGDARHPQLGAATCQPLSFHAYVAANCWHLLASLPEVDSTRIGVTGHSYGGKWALFAAALFDRFAAVAVSDPGIMFDEARPNVNYWDPWYLGAVASGERRAVGLPSDQHPRTGAYDQIWRERRDLHELHALIAPRPLLVSGGVEDPPERWMALNHLLEVHRLLGVSHRLAMTNRPGHDPTEASNSQLYAFLEFALRKP